MSENIEIFIHGPGIQPKVASVKGDNVLLEVLEAEGVPGVRDEGVLVFVDECGDALDEAIEIEDGEDKHEPCDARRTIAEIAIKSGTHVHVHKCRRILVTVTYNGVDKKHKFSPATTISTATKWAKRKFKIDPTSDFVLQISGTKTVPRQNEHLGDLVIGGVCTLSFDLVTEVNPQGRNEIA